MKRAIQPISFVVLALAYLIVPVAVFGQKDKEKDEKLKDKKESEQIIITRKGDTDSKVIIEVNGDKVLINGKEINEKDHDGDIIVRRHKTDQTWSFIAPDGFGAWGDNFSLFSGDENRAMLGVTTEKTEKGIEIQTISKDGGAEKAGLKKGDIIKKIDDTKIEASDDLSKTVRAHKPGDKVTVTYLRDGKEQKVTAELTKYKGVRAYSATTVPGQAYRYKSPYLDLEVPGYQTAPRTRTTQGFAYNWSGGSPKLGISVQDTEDGKGVKVLEVDEDGNGAKAGIKENDIITEVDGTAVNSTDAITKIIRDNKEKISVKVKLQRNGKTETLDVKIPRKLKTTDL